MGPLKSRTTCWHPLAHISTEPSKQTMACIAISILPKKGHLFRLDACICSWLQAEIQFGHLYTRDVVLVEQPTPNGNVSFSLATGYQNDYSPSAPTSGGSGGGASSGSGGAFVGGQLDWHFWVCRRIRPCKAKQIASSPRLLLSLCLFLAVRPRKGPNALPGSVVSQVRLLPRRSVGLLQREKQNNHRCSVTLSRSPTIFLLVRKRMGFCWAATPCQLTEDLS